MRFFTRISIAAYVVFCSLTTYAQSLTPGWYIGVIGSGGKAGNVSSIMPARLYVFKNTLGQNALFLEQQPAVFTTRNYGLLGAGGFQLGYRYCNFRLEGELFFGGSTTDRATVSPFTLTTMTADGPGAVFVIPGGSYRFNKWLPLPLPINVVVPPQTMPFEFLRFNERQVFGGGFINLLYEFYPENIEVSFVPYIGAGVGAVRVQNTFVVDYQNNQTVLNNVNLVSARVITNHSASAAQGIIGVMYLLDDFSNLALDYRYFASQRVGFFNNRRLTAQTLNLVFNYTFDED